ncbi:hypothetical protein SAMN05443252_10318 [Bacillus sp. OV322]|uniref:hypothetical protein n=1 Tax=Bacillus sp. OV322 TaxID=1882764 RepID=UPI0008E145AC|nr:hypothetical protein [Bacillus sp. OV322]SFC35452.1 hypothetical protein SAMN05443252_10318 [Bacillus sp. OV322]
MKKFLIGITLIGMTLAAAALFYISQRGLDIKVQNQTNKEIAGLYVTYNHIKKDISIPPIAAKSSYKLHVDPVKTSKADFNEGALKIVYKDLKGNMHSETVLGYFERSYSGDAVVKIKSVDRDGVLAIKINERVSLY